MQTNKGSWRCVSPGTKEVSSISPVVRPTPSTATTPQPTARGSAHRALYPNPTTFASPPQRSWRRATRRPSGSAPTRSSSAARSSCPACTPRLAAQLRTRGFEPVVVDASEFLEAGGAPRCPTLALDVRLSQRVTVTHGRMRSLAASAARRARTSRRPRRRYSFRSPTIRSRATASARSHPGSSASRFGDGRARSRALAAALRRSTLHPSLHRSTCSARVPMTSAEHRGVVRGTVGL